MKILYIGDIFSSKAIDYLENNLEQIKRDNKINIVFANAENATHGRGLNKKHYTRLKQLGIAAISMGNHTFSNNEIKEYINDATIARPANLNTKYGKDHLIVNYNGTKILLINMLGRVYMNNMALENPFSTAKKILDEEVYDYSIIDMHAEATSEKISIANYLDGQVSAVVGTHTHVQTADERVLPGGTLFITDIGMTGPLDSCIGDNKEIIIDRFLSGVYERSTPSESSIQFNAVILEFTKTGQNKISRINLK